MLHFIYNTLAVIGAFAVVLFVWQFIMVTIAVIELDRKAAADKAAEEDEIKATLDGVK